MGSTVLDAVEQEPGMTPVGGVDLFAGAKTTVATSGGNELPLMMDLEALFATVKPDVVVDFTNAEGGTTTMRTCIANGVRCVSGSTGISPDELSSIEARASEAGVGCDIGVELCARMRSLDPLGANCVELLRLCGRY